MVLEAMVGMVGGLLVGFVAFLFILVVWGSRD